MLNDAKGNENTALKEYLESLKVKSISLISEKNWKPRVLIKFADDDEFELTGEQKIGGLICKVRKLKVG